MFFSSYIQNNNVADHGSFTGTEDERVPLKAKY